jgi:hypothetical protein
MTTGNGFMQSWKCHSVRDDWLFNYYCLRWVLFDFTYSQIIYFPKAWARQTLPLGKLRLCVLRRVNRCNHLLNAKFGIRLAGTGMMNQSDFSVTKPAMELNRVAVNFWSMHRPPPHMYLPCSNKYVPTNICTTILQMFKLTRLGSLLTRKACTATRC